jgi:hypothetical protein
MKRTFGKGDDDYIKRKKNAFRFPKDPEAIFPQEPKPVYIEKRAAHVPANLRTKVKGIKASRLEGLRQKAEIEEALNKAEEKISNQINNIKNNSGMTIELDKEKNKSFSNLDKELQALEKMSLDNKDKNKHSTVRNKKKKKSKSYYIVNH